MTDIEFLQSSVLRGLVEILAQEKALDVQGALLQIHGTKTFGNLMDAQTGLYRESAAHVYEHLKEEIN
jgi:hypothetical protein